MRGPNFLLFYIVLSLGAYLYVRLLIARIEGDLGPVNLKLRQPYEIAYLRGGVEQLQQVATLSLLRRKLLDVAGGRLQATAAGAAGAVSDPIERAILDACRTPVVAATLEQNTGVQVAAEHYRLALADKGLVPSEAMQRRRRRFAVIAGLALLGLAAAKIAVALRTGHPNVLFLTILATLVAFAFSALSREHRTRLGREALKNLETLFARVKRNASPLNADQHHEALLLAAVYGVYVAPGIEEATWRKLFPRRKTASDGGGGGDSSGCGSGCGGGGGCGGCGS